MFEVKIYIETYIHGHKIGRAAGMWLIEYIKSNGEPETRKEIITREQTTEIVLVLELLNQALARLKKPCMILVNTECEHILNATTNHWLPQWQKNGWTKAGGKPVKNAELWKQCADLMSNHYLSFVKEWHSYKNFMQTEIRRELNQNG